MFRVRFSCHSRFSLPLFHIFCHVTPTLSGTFTKSKYKRFFRGLRDVCIAVAIESCARDSSPLFCHQWSGDRWTREFKKWRKRSCLRFLTLFDTDTLTQIYVVALTALLLKNSFKTFFLSFGVRVAVIVLSANGDVAKSRFTIWNFSYFNNMNNMNLLYLLWTSYVLTWRFNND